MKVKILKASKESYWYKKNIGEIFEVEYFNFTEYKIINNELYYCHYILKEDCEIINEDEDKNMIKISCCDTTCYAKPQMYLIKLKEYKIQVVCERCYQNGQVNEKCTQCGGKGVHNKTKQKWEVSKNMMSIENIDRDENGELRYWEDKSCFYQEKDKFLHFRYGDALRECKRRNEGLDFTVNL